MRPWTGQQAIELGLLTGQVAIVSRDDLVEDIVEQTKLALSVAIKAANKSAG